MNSQSSLKDRTPNTDEWVSRGGGGGGGGGGGVLLLLLCRDSNLRGCHFSSLTLLFSVKLIFL